jgi:hypothetical protein
MDVQTQFIGIAAELQRGLSSRRYPTDVPVPGPVQGR